MGAIAAVVNRKGENTVPTVVAMLKALTHRGIDAHGVATPDSAITAKTIEEIPLKEISSSVALGHNLSRVFSRDQPQPIQGNCFTLVFEGRLFPTSSLPEVREVAEKIGSTPKRNFGHIIESEGGFVSAIATSNEIIAGRDIFGTNPLYYGKNDTTCAIASECKALWALGIGNVESFPPGHEAVINAKGFSFKPIKTIKQPPEKDVNMESAANRLTDLLLESTKNRVSDSRKVMVAFSGGLDSSVIAVLAKRCGINVHLFSVGLENQPEVSFAKSAAEALGLPLHLQTYTISDVQRVLPNVLWIIEEFNVVKASIAVPFYWTAENASKLGFKVLLAGQGGDEVFGGYQRYLREYEQSGVTALQNIMYRDVANSYRINLQRDNQVCSFHKVELRFPFLDRAVVDFSLSLPLNLKIESAEDWLRKRVLRQVAQNLGIPKFIANKTKKAIQYSTGVNKAIQKLAKSKGLTPHKFVERVFQAVYPTKEAVG